MPDDILAEIVGQASFARFTPSQRTQALVRTGFGILGAALGVIGAVHFARRPDPITNVPMHASVLALFACLACFFLFNVALHRKWRWPGIAFVLSFIALFATRILFGP